MAGTAGGPSLPDNLPVLGDVVVSYAVDRFAVPNFGKVIGVADNMATLGGFGQLPYSAAGGLDLRHCTASSANLCNHNGYLIHKLQVQVGHPT